MLLEQYISALEGIQKQAVKQKRRLRVVRDSDLGWVDAPSPRIHEIALDDLMSSEFIAGVAIGESVVVV